MKYLFCVIAILIQPILLYFVFKKQEKPKAALRMPYIYVSGLYLIIQFYTYFKFFRKLPQDYAFLIQISILVGFLLVEAIILIGNHYIKRVDKDKKLKIEGIKNLIQNLEIKKMEFEDPEKLKHINEFLELLKYSDPVSMESDQRENMQLDEIIQKLDKNMTLEDIEKSCKKAIKIINARNLRIKNSKGES